MTDPSQPAEPQPEEDLPQSGGELPRRKPLGESQPQSGGSFFERTAPSTASANGLPPRRPSYDSRPARNDFFPRDDTLPRRGAQFSEPDSALPKRGEQPSQPGNGLPLREGDQLPQRGTDLPQRGDALPQRSTDLPQRGTDLPQRGSDLPQRGGLPQRDGSADALGALPRRTTRTRPAGRHRSPHRLSVASDAPALVLAVPGTAEADPTEIGARVASIASQSCPGVDIRVGYLDGDELPLLDSLIPAGREQAEQDQFPSVIVPLLLSPNPQFDPVVRQYASRPPLPAVVAAHLGPHPMVAEALHSRLAEAGLARQARSSGLSISSENRGIVVLADVGEEAASAAGVAAVLLASRLSVPVIPASLSDPSSIVDAVNRLGESGARPVLAPCLIGPETNISVLEDLSTALSAPCAPTLGAHQAIGQLVAVRYGAALARLSLAG